MKKELIRISVIMVFALILFACSSDSKSDTGSDTGTDSEQIYKIESLTAGITGIDSAVISWIAPAGADEYDIRYSTADITDDNWSAASQVSDEPDPQPEGKVELFRVAGLDENTDYYLAVKYRYGDQWSLISNIVSFYTSEFDARDKIVFSAYLASEDITELFIVDSDGSNLQRITYDYGLNAYATWSFDGRNIIFQTHRDGNFQIYRLDLVSNVQINISDNSYNDATPYCSPDGTVITFLSNQTSVDYSIYTMKMDGSDREKLVENTAVYNSDYFYRPSFSFDGTKVLYQYYNIDTTTGDLYWIDVNTSITTQITTSGSGKEADPRLSPDGSKIVYWDNSSGNDDIWTMDPDGTNRVNLTNASSRDSIPCWSPDGGKIAFQSDRDGSYELFVMDSDGSNVTQITFDNNNISGPSWSPVTD